MDNKKKKKKKIIIASSVILLIIGYLIYAGIRDTMTYYLTVSEVLAGNGKTPLSSPIRIGGTVSPSSVSWDPKTLHLAFEIGNGVSTMKVLYKGVVPDSFKPGREVVLEGTYEPGGPFVATTIMPKCASKYE